MELILSFHKSDRESIASVRCIEGLQVAVDDAHIWLRGIQNMPGAEMQVKQLPARQTFYIDENDLLFTRTSLTPVAKLPALEWKPIDEFISVEMPVAALPGQAEKLPVVRLAPTGNIHPGEALLTSLQVWKEYAETAPATRLAQLKFAVSENDDVLITGNPLPPLPGKEYWRCGDILLPNGYDFEIPMLAGFISEKFNAGQDALIVFERDGDWQKIDKLFFVPAKRSAVRLTVNKQLKGNE